MLSHKFKVGQSLVMWVGVGKDRPSGSAVSVTRLLPIEGGEPQYRIKVDVGGQEWVVRESELDATVPAGRSERSPTSVMASVVTETRSKAAGKKT